MTKKTYDDKLFLDMPFEEALGRFAKTDMEEVRASIARSKKAQPIGGKVRKPPKAVASQKVVKLGTKRKPGSQ
jgi:hypothetical protein